MTDQFQVSSFLETNKQKIYNLLNITNNGVNFLTGHVDLKTALVAHVRDGADMLVIFDRSHIVIDDEAIHINAKIIGVYHLAKWDTTEQMWRFAEHIGEDKGRSPLNPAMGSNTHDDFTLISVYQLSSMTPIKIAERNFGVLYWTEYGGYTLPEDVASKFGVKHYNTNTRDKQEIVQEFFKHKSNCGSYRNCPCSSMLIYWIPKGYENYWSIDEYDGKETVDIDTVEYERDALKRENEELKRQIIELTAKLNNF